MSEQSSALSDQLVFVLKVFLLSIGISFAIKYLAPGIPIPATNSVAMTIVFLPSLVIGLFLGWRWWLKQKT